MSGSREGGDEKSAHYEGELQNQLMSELGKKVYAWSELQPLMPDLQQALLTTGDKRFSLDVAQKINQAALDSSNVKNLESTIQRFLQTKDKEEFFADLSEQAAISQKFYNTYSEELKKDAEKIKHQQQEIVERLLGTNNEKTKQISKHIFGVAVRETMKAAHNRLEYGHDSFHDTSKYADALTNCEEVCKTVILVLNIRKRYNEKFRLGSVSEEREKILDKIDTALNESVREYSRSGNLEKFRKEIGNKLTDISKEIKDKNSKLRDYIQETSKTLLASVPAQQAQQMQEAGAVYRPFGKY